MTSSIGQTGIAPSCLLSHPGDILSAALPPPLAPTPDYTN